MVAIQHMNTTVREPPRVRARSLKFRLIAISLAWLAFAVKR